MPERGFTPGRDRGRWVRRPIPESMSSAVTRNAAEIRASDLHLLRDCLAFGHPARRRAPAKVRLEEELGPELARKLLRSLLSSRARLAG